MKEGSWGSVLLRTLKTVWITLQNHLTREGGYWSFIHHLISQVLEDCPCTRGLANSCPAGESPPRRKRGRNMRQEAISRLELS